MTGRRWSERGQAAGIETISFGFFVLLGATLLVATLWSAFDARSTLDNAARDYLRAYTAAANRADAQTAGRQAASVSIGHRWPDAQLTIDAPVEPFGPCRPATVRLSIDIDAVRIPFVGTVGAHTVESEQRELVQPFGHAVDELGPDSPNPCEVDQ